MYIQSIYILLYVALGGNFGRHQNATFCYQKVATRSRSVSVHLDFSYDASRAHRRGRGDNRTRTQDNQNACEIVLVS